VRRWSGRGSFGFFAVCTFTYSFPASRPRDLRPAQRRRSGCRCHAGAAERDQHRAVRPSCARVGLGGVVLASLRRPTSRVGVSVGGSPRSSLATTGSGRAGSRRGRLERRLDDCGAVDRERDEPFVRPVPPRKSSNGSPSFSVSLSLLFELRPVAFKLCRRALDLVVRRSSSARSVSPCCSQCFAASWWRRAASSWRRADSSCLFSATLPIHFVTLVAVRLVGEGGYDSSTARQFEMGANAKPVWQRLRPDLRD
jgi:hypothetical protein